MYLSKFEKLFCVYVSLLTAVKADGSTDGACNKPKCFIFEERNASTEVTVRFSEGKKASVTTFCFRGLPQSLLRLWTNPVLHISRKDIPMNESSKYITYFGNSVSNVEHRSKQPGYVMLQSWISSMSPLKQTDDISLEPFNLSCYIIDTNVDYKAKVKIKAADLWFIAFLIAGIVIFFSAKSWSHNTTLHIGTGVSLGIVASVLILVFVLTRFLPSKLKNLGYLFMLFGGSVSLWMLTTFGSFFTNPMTETFVENWQYFLGYVITVGILSFAVVYRYGPVTDERSLSLIQWFLQLVGLVLVYNSTQIREVSIALILILLAIYNFPRRLLLNERSKNWWYRFFPPKIKLLTEEEYIIQGNLETKRELDKLRDYCRSPDCQAWKIISKLKSPQRFADFVEGNSWHVTNEELLEYDSGPDPTPPHLISDEDEDEEEMDFMLSSP
ncbi:nuclear envelope integral membrane protein 1-like isoform X2 [Mercenaria mercenaria]|uniref:nuclear envelope integral membrane protein 1-like isoform X2 n=1 Tax=Mercenaria mercenaria TaxID=6596 RepID=UPI001E1DF909|nr:nuclear envelope integral membrane protein 1-like isoform X2 [Mercenaria mercenaria]